MQPSQALGETGGRTLPRLKLAVLDDYQFLARDYGDWESIDGDVEISVFNKRFPTEHDLIQALRPFDIVVLLRERTHLTAKTVEGLPRLKLIVTTGPRTDAVDFAAARRRGIPVCATRHSMKSTIEFVWGLILACARQIPQSDANMRAGGWQLDSHRSRLGREISGATLGVLGLGEIGAAVARLGGAFDMEVIAWSEHLVPEQAEAIGAEYVTKQDLFRRADIVTIHSRLSDRTRGLVSRQELAMMKPTAYLINTSRGAIVDEAELVCALQEGRIGGAALDVFEHEPLPAEHPLRALPNVVLSPHAAALAQGHVTAWFHDIAEDVRAWLDGAPIRLLT